MAAPSQTGQEMLVGIGDYTFSGFVVESLDREATGDIEEVRDENDAVATKIVSNKGQRVSGRLLVKATSGSPDFSDLDATEVGSAITLNSVAYMVESWKVSRSRKVCAVDFSAIKEDSMDYS